MQRTKQIEKLISKFEDLKMEIEDLRDKAREKFDNGSERWQESERGEEASQYADDLEEISDELDSLFDRFNDLHGREYAAKYFNIPIEDVKWHHSGICYDRVCVRGKANADKVTEKVKGQTVNGGWFHGMPLGVQHKLENDWYDVMC